LRVKNNYVYSELGKTPLIESRILARTTREIHVQLLKIDQNEIG